ncbi:hypothetical protein DMA15_18735 [Streptomyces sp. WAC 01529]|uniref:DUF3566 domain-containing protein n=1 Tax=Streptomyces sp. WAC 01529 TaxID=2203205 RepID=UPI000F6B81F9|nr:DUF3566 domain-containing protein [Streptomyces sp. WAC 01529]AZM54351.1 hypothetical protein DMA15_18735 [Streptomyces sp. WAC 01529]
MSGATGAEAKRSGTTGKDGARGSAADAKDAESHGSQGGTVTDTRDADTAGGALPGERKTQQQASQPYHPPQAYQQGAGGGSGAQAGAVRKPRTGARTVPRTRKARLRVARADPWSVMKVSFLLSIALGICTIVAAAVLWMVMDAMGVFSTVGGTISEATGSNESNGFDLQSFLSLPRVLTFTAIIAVIDVVLATALATLGAFIYNLSAGFVGGVELTLAEDE